MTPQALRKLGLIKWQVGGNRTTMLPMDGRTIHAKTYLKMQKFAKIKKMVVAVTSKNTWLSRVCLFLVSLSIGGCSFVIEREGVARVSREGLVGVVGERDARLPILLENVGNDFIVVSVSSEVDLVGEYQRGYFSSAESYFCDDDKSKYFVGMSTVYFRGGGVNSQSSKDRKRVEGFEREGSDIYDVIIFDRWKVTKDADRMWPGYSKLAFDLHETPRDVCIKLVYANMITRTFSNEIRVSRQEIQELLGE